MNTAAFTLIVILGPTASSKSQWGYQLAKTLNCAILSFDSRQCYKEMKIGTWVPDLNHYGDITHYFVHSHHLKDRVDVQVFQEYSLEVIEKEKQKNQYLVVVGGTGLYLKVLSEGMVKIPPIENKIRVYWQQRLEKEGLAVLAAHLKKVDIQTAQWIDLKNPHRVLRALQVFEKTGIPLVEHHQRFTPEKRDFKLIKYGIALERPILYEKINNRVEAMFQMGLKEEADKLFVYRNHKALQTIAYKEIFDWKEGKYSSLEQCKNKIKQNTRNYAKRQLTWFRKDKSISWIGNFKDLQL